MPVGGIDSERRPFANLPLWRLRAICRLWICAAEIKEAASRQRRLLLGSRLLGVAGQLQRHGEGEHAVVHLIAKRLFDHGELLGQLVTASRDFC
jgi:hypothetical protein